MNPSAFFDDLARFWARVNKSDGCWEWTGEVNRYGYGRLTFWFDGRSQRVLAHRMMVHLHGGAIGDGQVVMHDCDNPPCVNPAHLRVGTQSENLRDARRKGRADLSGLALAWSNRPTTTCKRCGEGSVVGRRSYCDPCDVEVKREYQKRYREKSRGGVA